MSFGNPDLVIVGLIALSILIGIIRGFIKELISLITWVVAITLAAMFTSSLATFMTFTHHEMVRMITAFLLIFVGTIFMGALVNFAIGSIVRKTPFSVPDRILGSLFGFLRGLVFITLLVLLGGLTSFPETTWWKHSPAIKQFQVAALWVKEQLPAEHAEGFHFQPRENKDNKDSKDKNTRKESKDSPKTKGSK